MSIINGNTSPSTPGGIFRSLACTFGSNVSFGRFCGVAPATQPSLFSSPIVGRLPAFTFGGAFGTPAAVTILTPGFGVTNLMLGQPQQQQQLPVPMSIDAVCAEFIKNVSIFDDERDEIAAKRNYLQAMWGTGKLYYPPPLDISQQNPLIGYSRMPGQDNNLGLVALIFNKDLATVKIHQPQIKQMLHHLMGNNIRLAVQIEVLRELGNTQCQMVIYVVEKLQVLFGPYGTRRIPATELENYLAQTNVKPYLDSMAIIPALARTQPDEEQKEYLEKPPSSIEPRLWHNSNLDNPEPEEFIPVPNIGFNELQWRLKWQKLETDKHELYLKMKKKLQELDQRSACAAVKLIENKRKLEETTQKLHSIVLKEEYIRRLKNKKLENLQDDVSEPTEFEGELYELLDDESLNDLKEIVMLNQGALELLGKSDLLDVSVTNIIEEDSETSDDEL